MKVVVQRVKSAKLEIDNKLVASIKKGLVVFVGFSVLDENKNMDWLVNKVSGLRIFEDENCKMNLNVSQVNGEILIIPNFTLYADCSHGFRPSFINAMRPEIATKLFDKFVELMKEKLPNIVQTGVFGADMQITQQNDGPITIIIED